MTETTQFHPPVMEYSTSKISREDLRTIASQQRVIILCILLQMLALVSQFILPEAVRPLVGVGSLAVGVLAAVFVFMLAIKLYGTVGGVIDGIIALIPLVGLIPLLLVNGKATRTLKENGINVGMLGANPQTI